ncbi:hypothetical protein DITRI_Ditri13aG0120500 [Diplodiscus trichospermus]
MGFSDIKAWLICVVLIISMVVAMNQVDAAARTPINAAVIDPCKRPGGPHPGCHPDPNSPPQEANPYHRGCSKIHRCRRGGDSK